MMDPDLERHYPTPLAGIDEAGRGPWAGPVVAAAVIIPPGAAFSGLNDSKQLSASAREHLFDTITRTALYGIGTASAEEIDRVNILQATFLAMRRAVAALPQVPAFALIDGNRVPPNLPCRAEALVKGDGRCLSIAAASVLAKVTRDRHMAALARDYPHYGWEHNAGYGTKAHRDGIAAKGICAEHRKSFAPIRLWMQEQGVAA